MSTRGTIIFVGPRAFGDNPEAIRLYHHCDAYPSNILEILGNTVEAAIQKAENHHARCFMKDKFNHLTAKLPAEVLAGLFIGESTTIHGIGAHIEHTQIVDSALLKSWDEETLESICGEQMDLEWVYVVNSVDRSIGVFGGGYTNEPSANFVRINGAISPFVETEDMCAPYKKESEDSIQLAIENFEGLGFSFGKVLE